MNKEVITEEERLKKAVKNIISVDMANEILFRDFLEEYDDPTSLEIYLKSKESATNAQNEEIMTKKSRKPKHLLKRTKISI